MCSTNKEKCMNEQDHSACQTLKLSNNNSCLQCSDWDSLCNVDTFFCSKPAECNNADNTNDPDKKETTEGSDPNALKNLMYAGIAITIIALFLVMGIFIMRRHKSNILQKIATSKRAELELEEKTRKKIHSDWDLRDIPVIRPKRFFEESESQPSAQRSFESRTPDEASVSGSDDYYAQQEMDELLGRFHRKERDDMKRYYSISGSRAASI